MIHYLIKLLALMYSANCLAETCELTEEYRNERSQFVRDAKSAYDACTSSVSDAEYWRAVSNCKKRGDGENIRGGCQHVAWRTPTELTEEDFEHCQIFYLSYPEIRDLWDQYVAEEEIVMCTPTEQ